MYWVSWERMVSHHRLQYWTQSITKPQRKALYHHWATFPYTNLTGLSTGLNRTIGFRLREHAINFSLYFFSNNIWGSIKSQYFLLILLKNSIAPWFAILLVPSSIWTSWYRPVNVLLTQSCYTSKRTFKIITIHAEHSLLVFTNANCYRDYILLYAILCPKMELNHRPPA